MNAILVSSLPIIFMLHDFEEILMMKPWVKKNEEYIYGRFPKLGPRLVSHLKDTSTEGFALCVAILFFMLGAVTLASLWEESYMLWMGIFMVFSIHIVVHIIQWIAFRRYIPAIITSLLCIPYCIYGIRQIVNMFTLSNILIYSLITSVIVFAFLFIGHRYVAKWIK
ncbi:HXXEE domain-containing protein [Prevotella sp.]|uniref:HXXEE domain-containing protein n=1 Tax=Prevotella sp. TaxID=59823 RepID=UPI003DA6BEA8